MTAEILRIEALRVTARSAAGDARLIVDGVSLALRRAEVLGLIGESGAGKSTLGLAALGYARPGCAFTAGQVLFEGVDVLRLTPEGRRALRGRRIAYVPQSAAAAFNRLCRPRTLRLIGTSVPRTRMVARAPSLARSGSSTTTSISSAPLPLEP